MLLLPSRPGEFHPEPLTEPDLNLSIHPARAIARRLPPSIDHRVPPVAGWPVVLAEQRSPFGPAPLQSLRSYYGLLRPCASHRYSDPRGLSRLRSLPLHRGTGSHVPYKSLVELRAAYMPDAVRAVSGHPPN